MKKLILFSYLFLHVLINLLLTFKNLYGKELEGVKILHYTQFLHRLLSRELYSLEITLGATVIAVACPICRILLTMGIEGENTEDRIQVQDVSSIFLQAL